MRPPWDADRQRRQDLLLRAASPSMPAQPTVVFIHGVLNDHSVWILQTRYFAHHGWNVLALDLPGHCKSEGEPPAPWRKRRTSSWPCWMPPRWKRRPWWATASARWSPWRPPRALGADAPGAGGPRLPDEGHARAAGELAANRRPSTWSTCIRHDGAALFPRSWQLAGRRHALLMRRVLASNPRVNVFHRGFAACDSYAGGEAAIGKSPCPVLFLLGRGTTP